MLTSENLYDIISVRFRALDAISLYTLQKLRTQPEDLSTLKHSYPKRMCNLCCFELSYTVSRNLDKIDISRTSVSSEDTEVASMKAHLCCKVWLSEGRSSREMDDGSNSRLTLDSVTTQKD